MLAQSDAEPLKSHKFQTLHTLKKWNCYLHVISFQSTQMNFDSLILGCGAFIMVSDFGGIVEHLSISNIWICLKVYLDLSEYREPQKSDSLSFSLVEQP